MSQLAGKQLRTDLYENWPHHSFAPATRALLLSFSSCRGRQNHTRLFWGDKILGEIFAAWVSEKTIMDNQIQKGVFLLPSDGEKRFDPCPPRRKSWGSGELPQTEVYTVFFPDAPSLLQLTS